MESKEHGPFKTKGELREAVTETKTEFGATKTYIASCFRYPHLWAVKEMSEGKSTWRRISLFTLTKEKGKWYASEERSEWSDDAPLSCPLGYLALVEKGCAEWRLRVLKNQSQKELAKEVRKLAKIKTVKVYLRSSQVPWGIVENSWPLQARYDGVLYKIMPKDIEKYEVIDNEADH